LGQGYSISRFEGAEMMNAMQIDEQLNGIEKSINTPVVSAICDEPEGKIERFVYRMTLAPNNIQKMWDKSKKYRTLFTDDINGDFRKYVEAFITQDPEDPTRFEARGLFWVIDDFVGVYYLTHIYPQKEATAHFTFFDGRMNGREDLTKLMILYVFERYGFGRLNIEVGAYVSKTTIVFIERALGAELEGRKRKAVDYKGEKFDLLQYGILREEAEQWAPKLVK
jgi:hypothetical protein